MTRKAGQIIQKGERGDRWMVRVYRGEDQDGKRIYDGKIIHGTKKDAQRYLTSVMRSLDLGTYVEPSATTLNDYLDEWAQAAKGTIRERTFNDYMGLLARYVRPPLGTIRLTRVSPAEIQKLYNDMRERGLSPRTIQYTHAVLSRALKMAVKWRKINQNPAEYTDRPQLKRAEMRALSPEETRAFLAVATEDKWGILFEFALATGMRPGEYLALQWKDVDLHAGTAIVRRVLVRQKGPWYFAEPKTAKSRRTVPLPPSLLRGLKLHKHRQAEARLAYGPGYHSHDLMFTADNGQPIDEHNLIHRHFKPLLQTADLPDTIRLYDLRHTCATLLLAAGENPKIVSERLGHASIVLTLDTYSHVLPTMQQSAVTKLEAALYGG